MSTFAVWMWPVLAVTGCGGCAPSVDKGDSGAESGSSPDDTGCSFEPYDECADDLGRAAAAEELVTGTAPDFDACPLGVVRIVRTQEEYAALLEDLGVAGETSRDVDFETEQAVCFGSYSECGWYEDVREFRWNGDASLLHARILWNARCWYCDYPGDPTFQLWATPIADVSVCRYGER